jgi:hypothetical protein
MQEKMAAQDAEAAVAPKKLDTFSFRTVIILHAAAIALFALGTGAGHRKSPNLPQTFSCLGTFPTPGDIIYKYVLTTPCHNRLVSGCHR